jgi:hypothetical protein
MKKENIGTVIILLGIGLIGLIWFKRNKPTTGDKQLSDLKAKSNNLATTADSIDKPFEYSQETLQNQGANPYTSSTLAMGTLTPQQIKDIKDSIGTILDPSAIYSGQINLQNSNLNQFSNYDFSNVDWSNIKIK